ncbi:hypothetical protein UACE39S_05456 [Ureibacillus acetophenoni]
MLMVGNVAVNRVRTNALTLKILTQLEEWFSGTSLVE